MDKPVSLFRHRRKVVNVVMSWISGQLRDPSTSGSLGAPHGVTPPALPLPIRARTSGIPSVVL